MVSEGAGFEEEAEVGVFAAAVVAAAAAALYAAKN